MGLRSRKRVRVHLVGVPGSVEGLLVKKPWNVSGHYELVDVTYLESPSDVHPLDSGRTLIPHARVAFVEVLR